MPSPESMERIVKIKKENVNTFHRLVKVMALTEKTTIDLDESSPDTGAGEVAKHRKAESLSQYSAQKSGIHWQDEAGAPGTC